MGAPEPEGRAQEVEGGPEQPRAGAGRGRQRATRKSPDRQPAPAATWPEGERTPRPGPRLRRPPSARTAGRPAAAHRGRGPRLGSKVIEADGVRKGFGDRLLIDDLSFSLPPAGIVGVIGANGAGKTTLFRMVVGQEQADEGTLELGDSVELAHVDQSRAAL